MDTKAETLMNTIKEALLRCDLPIDKARGQCYDGAANMRGHVNGVQAQMLRENPHCLYVYCVGHKLNLVVQDAAKALVEGSRAMSLLQSCTTFIRDSPKRLEGFRELAAEVVPDSETALRPLCPTRWVMRFRSLNSFVEKYPALLQWYEERRHDMSMPAESRGKAMSLLQELERFEIFFMIRAMRLLFGVVDPVHKAVQGVKEMIGDVKREIDMLKETLHIIRDRPSGNAGQTFYQDTKVIALELQIDLPALPRGHARMRMRGGVLALEITEDDIVSYYVDLYRSLFDAAITGINSRYHTSSLERAAILETVFTKECTVEVVEKVCEIYGCRQNGSGDINEDLFKVQRVQWIEVAQELNVDSSPNGFLEVLKGDKIRILFMSDLFKVLQLYATLPCTSCTAERTFSCLRKIKTFLCTTMSQQRLNPGIHVHKKEADQIDRRELLDEFISRNQARKNVFAFSKDVDY